MKKVKTSPCHLMIAPTSSAHVPSLGEIPVCFQDLLWHKIRPITTGLHDAAKNFITRTFTSRFGLNRHKVLKIYDMIQIAKNNPQVNKYNQATGVVFRSFFWRLSRLLIVLLDWAGLFSFSGGFMMWEEVFRSELQGTEASCSVTV